MKRFIMPGGRYSGRRYGMVNIEEYQQIVKHEKDASPLQLAWIVNKPNLTVPTVMRKLTAEIMNFAEDMRKIDTLTLVVYKPVLFKWLDHVAMAGHIHHTTIVTDGSFGLDVPGLPTTDILLVVNDSMDISYVTKFGNQPNVLYSILVPAEKVHWALGALKHSGRPDINIYVDIQTLSPTGGASL